MRVPWTARRSNQSILKEISPGTTTNRDAIESYDLSYIEHPFFKMVAGEFSFVDDSIEGNAIHVNANLPEGATVIKETDGGNALIYEINVGSGKVLVLNTLEYAGAPALYGYIRNFVADLSAQQFALEDIWAEGDDIVQFTAYKQANGDMHIYFLATDWYHADAPVHTAFLRIGDFKYPINISYGTMIKAVGSGNVGAWFDNEDCDVLEIADGMIKVQGIGSGKLFVAKNGLVSEREVDFSANSVLTVEI